MKLPSFVRQNRSQKKRVGDSWRKPRGIDNKLRMQWKSAGAIPRVGYRSARKTRGLHPCGKKEVLVSNERDLLRVKDEVVRFASALGKKKYEALKRKALELKLHVVN